MNRSLRLSPSSVRSFQAPCAPLALFKALYGGDRYSFLCESLDAHGASGRYSLLGGRPRIIFSNTRTRIQLRHKRGVSTVSGEPLERLQNLLRDQPATPEIEPFAGGAVGYLGYDMVQFCENVSLRSDQHRVQPDSCFMIPNEILVLDHQTGVCQCIVYGSQSDTSRLDQIERAICEAAPRIDETPRRPGLLAGAQGVSGGFCHTSRDEYLRSVERAQQYIRAGDIFQLVLSRRMEFQPTRTPLELYEALRRSNPSPYMYFLHLDGCQILGSSPEVLVKTHNGEVITRPLAGTRPRGKTPNEDQALERELMANPKERAEHVMLLDLARNDIGRVCEPGSVRTTAVMEVERFSRLMHLVSEARGNLTPGREGMDVIRATFPAGTVSGAPKVRAMQIIDELEPVRRGVYAGAIGYLGANGNLDLCIAIRTIVLCHGRGFLQAGAGIVADSIPELEFEETALKAQALLHAISTG